MSWSKGYYTDTGYTCGFYSQLTPLSIFWAALIKNHVLPIDSFRYIDMGCGQGYSLIMNAMNHPNAEFIGLDLMPEHIQHATVLAEKLDLKNIKFYEFDFLTADYDQLSIGEFEYVVAHGITTWVSENVRNGLSKVVDKALKIGGVFYNSYNTPYYWQQLMSFQHLARSFSKNNSGEVAITKALEFYEFVNKLVPDFLDSNPHLREKFKSFSTASKEYLVHEFCNQNWRLVFFDEEYEINSKIKLNYLGSMNLTEEFDQHYPEEFIKRIANENLITKTILKDTFLSKSFKQDLWIKGRPQENTSSIAKELNKLKVFTNWEQPKYDSAESIKIKAGPIEIQSKNPIAYEILQKSKESGFDLNILIKDQTDINELVRVVSILIDSKYISIGINNSNKTDVNYIKTILNEISNGKSYNFIPVGYLSSAVALDTIGSIMLLSSFDFSDKAAIVGNTLRLLKKRGNKIYDNGVEIFDERLIRSLNTFYDEKFIRIKSNLSILGAI
jgi:hypothetical protein